MRCILARCQRSHHPGVHVQRSGVTGGISKSSPWLYYHRGVKNWEYDIIASRLSSMRMRRPCRMDLVASNSDVSRERVCIAVMRGSSNMQAQWLVTPSISLCQLQHNPSAAHNGSILTRRVNSDRLSPLQYESSTYPHTFAGMQRRCHIESII